MVSAARRNGSAEGTTLRHEAHEQPKDSAIEDAPGAASAFREKPPPPRRGRLAVGPAADVIGSALDLHMTGNHVVHAMAPGFCDAASVYLLERWLVDESAGTSADPPQIEARRLALRVGAAAAESTEGVLPIDEVLVFPRQTPYARALATGHAQLLDAVDTHTFDRLAASGHSDARIHDLLRTASFLVVPIRLQSAVIGFIACTRGPHLPPFGLEDMAGVESLAARAAVALDNARRYEHERRTALAIRRSMLPDTDRTFEGCRVAHDYRPAGPHDIIGGDWFDVLPRPGGRVGLIVGDAMGHGPEAAVAMIQLRTAARTLAALDTDPRELLHRLDALAADTPDATFATCVYAEWDAEQHTCTVVGAGHPPPLIRAPGEAARPVPLGAGLPLGLSAWSAEPSVLEIHQPTLLLLYSDGLIESRRSDIDAGIARLARSLDHGIGERAPGGPVIGADGVDRAPTGPGTDPVGDAAARAAAEAAAVAEVDVGQEQLQSLCDTLLCDQPADATTDDRTVLLAALTPG
ncbi:SpoIIE family protein phosphatase [Streptomyces sp. NPDC008139]|uniref:PP2C family protein-serine/threonine phosphatase n=1 Tax=Streptomyces sp. NPDC008139 TaxID=3364814 RepID=UPI0036EC1A41